MIQMKISRLLYKTFIIFFKVLEIWITRIKKEYDFIIKKWK